MIKDSKLMWVPWVDPAEATVKVAEMYERVRQQFSATSVPPVAMVYSLRPELGIVKNDFRNAVLDDNSLGGRRTELINLAVSGLNACSFCASAHAGTMVRQHGSTAEEAIARFIRSLGHAVIA